MNEAARNPKMVVDAVIDSGKEEKAVKVFPMTIRRYALLEKLGSPFAGGEGAFDVNAIIPAVYVMSTPKEKLREYTSADADRLVSDAFDWADGLELDDLPEMVKALTNQMLAVNKAAPDSVPDAKKN